MSLTNDLLLTHIRALARAVGHAPTEDDVKAALKAAAWVQAELGLDGAPVANSQLHPDQSEAPDDSTLASDCDSISLRTTGKAIHDLTYMPHLGVVGFSIHRYHDWSKLGRDLDLTYGDGKDKPYAIPEETILGLAKTIETHRRLSGVAQQIRDGKVVGRTGYGHPLRDETDALAVSDHDIELSESRARLSIHSGSTYLNGSASEHMHWIEIAIEGPDGQDLVSFAMTPDQFAQLITCQMAVPVTCTRYWSRPYDAVRLRERVTTPESIMERARKRIQKTIGDEDKRLHTLVAGLASKIEDGKAPGIKDLREIVRNLQNIVGNREANAAYAAARTLEEAGKLAEGAVLRVVMAQGRGGGGQEVARMLGEAFHGRNLLPAPAAAVVAPVQP